MKLFLFEKDGGITINIIGIFDKSLQILIDMIIASLPMNPGV